MKVLKMSSIQRIVFLLVIIFNLGVVSSQILSSQGGNRLYSGDTSCICGIDSTLLARIETILTTITAHSCSIPTSATTTLSLPEISSSHDAQVGGISLSHSKQPSIQISGGGGSQTGSSISVSSNPAPSSHVQSEKSESVENHHQQQQQQQKHESHENPEKSVSASSHQISGNLQQQQHQVHVASTLNLESTNKQPNKQNNENQAESSLVGSTATKPISSETTTITQRPESHVETQIESPSPSSSSSEDPDVSSSSSAEVSRETAGPTNTGFLNGMTISPVSSHNLALAKLNQSSQNVNEKDMESALELTVPNLVSNIFSNIKNLTMQSEQNLERPQLSTLTSIDGSSVDIHGQSKDQITADGEKMFDIWLEHQLETLNLTAVMANHIRKSAGILFRRIIKQYVERVERMGGKVDKNIQRATQMALNNTQNLVAFLLKNYVNFAAGIMQILGEQVSRVGKRLDSTGDTIAHISLNPFDIVSNVIESLPNPSDYSNYFRNFGKALLGEFSNGGSSSGTSNAGSGGPTQGQQNSGSSQNQQGGLITKTIGAFTKFGSWLG